MALVKEWYLLSTGDIVVPLNTMSPKSIRMPDDADFELVQVCVAKATSLNFKFQIKKGSTDKYLSNNPIPYLAVGRNGVQAAGGTVPDNQDIYDIFPEGRVVFPAGSDVTIELTDYSGAANTIDFVLGGFKVRKTA